MEKELRDSVKKIALLIREKTNFNEGLLSGGEILYLYKYASLTKREEDFQSFETSLQSFLNEFQNCSSLSYCEGLFGNIWMISYLEKEGILSDILSEIKEEINTIFNKAGKTFGNHKNFDFLHGLLGLIHSGIICNEIDREAIIKLLDNLTKEKILSENGIYFTDWINIHRYNNNEEYINFGLSHGIPSIPAVLLKANYTDNRELKDTAEGVLNFILSHKLNDGPAGNLYPTIINKKDKKMSDLGSRLSWCYGDLGIACSFWNSGKILNNETYKNEAIEILKHNLKRRNLKEERVIDAGICHGTAGIAHIYNRFYKETGIEAFNEARWFWMNETLKMAKFEDGLAGYKAHCGEEVGFSNSYGLLEGITGIGLVMLGFLTDNIEDLNWDQCLLIS